MKRTRLMTPALGAVTAAALALTGCTKPEETPPDPTVTPTAGATQPEAAKAMVSCLKAAGVPAVEEPLEDSQGQILLSFEPSRAYAYDLGSGRHIFPGDQVVEALDKALVEDQLIDLAKDYDPSLTWKYSPDGRTVIIEGEEIPWEIANQARMNEASEIRYLIVDQTDYTEVFISCLEQSGYTEPVYDQLPPDPEEEMIVKQVMFDSTNRWIACARENGYPDLADPAEPVADEFLTMPEAILPGDTTPDQLRTLLGACPNFDAEQYAALDEAAANLGDDLTMERVQELAGLYPGAIPPQITFDIPGIESLLGVEGVEISAADKTRAEQLVGILVQAQDAYNNSRLGTQN
ncbi:MAG: hypothetical protein LBH68_05595 [Bifidobacteriaceae bacterium]|jgi:hypothetical protein|nr:hypothetical protein [Bifidobacteriaceae bacterium]